MKDVTTRQRTRSRSKAGKDDLENKCCVQPAELETENAREKKGQNSAAKKNWVQPAVSTNELASTAEPKFA